MSGSLESGTDARKHRSSNAPAGSVARMMRKTRSLQAVLALQDAGFIVMWIDGTPGQSGLSVNRDNDLVQMRGRVMERPQLF